jgi:hypothetical protein
MNRHFARIRSIVERHGGTVEKFIRDAVMAVFGIPVLHEDDALRAVRAAAEIRDALGALNAELEEARGLAIRFRTGVTTGEVVAGDPASGTTLVTGDTVNTAARLEHAAPPGEILLGRLTWQLVRDAAVATGRADAARGIVAELEPEMDHGLPFLNARADLAIELGAIRWILGDMDAARRHAATALDLGTAKANLALARKSRALAAGDLSAL